jgi:glycosyltransferase involved in cell wall biosynthesis
MSTTNTANAFTRPFVSVITPTYNRRKFLPILIHLYQQQTYPKNLRELIIFDDSPTSNEDIIPKNDETIKYLVGYYVSDNKLDESKIINHLT